eukprot:366360-Chlamydomonas_euryale.AAC.6
MRIETLPTLDEQGHLHPLHTTSTPPPHHVPTAALTHGPRLRHQVRCCCRRQWQRRRRPWKGAEVMCCARACTP